MVGGELLSINLSAYLTTIRRKIKDMGIAEHEEFIGNGILTDFYLSNTPIKTGAIEVYLDDIETTNFSVDYDTGLLEFAIAPLENVVIKVLYISYIYSDTELILGLESVIEEAMLVWDVETFVIEGSAPTSYIDIAPSSILFKLWMLMFLRDIKLDDIPSLANQSISWSTDEGSVNRRGIIRDSIISIDMLEKRINKLLWKMSFYQTAGYVIQGGSTPESYYGVGDSYVPEERY